MAERLDIIISAKDEASPALDKAGSALGRIGEIAGGILASGVLAKVGDALIGAFQAGAQEAMEEQVGLAKLEAIIKSTGGAAGVTTKEMDDLAVAMQNVTRFEDDTVREAQAVLLTFTNLGKDVLPVALARAADMAEVFGMDLPSAARMLARALDDPTQGFGMLSRVIGKLPADQEAAIQGMAEMGNVSGAQAAMLDVLNTKFGGVAETVGNTTAGAFERLKNRMMDIAGGVASGVTDPLGRMVNHILDDGIPALNALGEAAKNLGGLLALVGQGWESIFQKFGQGMTGGGGKMVYDPASGEMVWQENAPAVAGKGAEAPWTNPYGAANFPKTPAWMASDAADAEEQRRLGTAIGKALAGTDVAKRMFGFAPYPAGSGAAGGAGGGAPAALGFADLMARAFPSMGAAQAWQGAFASQHGGQAAGATDLRDKMAGDRFAAKYGRAATQGEWEQRYYKGSFEGVDETGLDDMFGKPGTWETLVTMQDEAQAKRNKELSDAFAAVFKTPIPVTFVAPSMASGGFTGMGGPVLTHPGEVILNPADKAGTQRLMQQAGLGGNLTLNIHSNARHEDLMRDARYIRSLARQ